MLSVNCHLDKLLINQARSEAIDWFILQLLQAYWYVIEAGRFDIFNSIIALVKCELLVWSSVLFLNLNEGGPLLITRKKTTHYD